MDEHPLTIIEGGQMVRKRNHTPFLKTRDGVFLFLSLWDVNKSEMGSHCKNWEYLMTNEDVTPITTIHFPKSGKDKYD